MLTKEQCKWALNKMVYTSSSRWHNRDSKRAKPYHLFNFPKCQLYKGDYKALNIIDSLIEEHFSNPPLQFEELKEGMWIWDNQLKWFFRVVLCDVKVQGCESLKMFKVKKYEGGSMLMIYEPNRFYRKEVQE